MIRMPPPDAKPRLVPAAGLAFGWPLGLALASSLQPGAGDLVQGHLIVAAIALAPFVAAIASRAAPGLTAPWGEGPDLFFKATRASVFLAGFVLLYMGVNWVMTGQPPAGWKLGAAISAAAVLSWWGLLSIGPWSKMSGGRGDA